MSPSIHLFILHLLLQLTEGVGVVCCMGRVGTEGRIELLRAVFVCLLTSGH